MSSTTTSLYVINFHYFDGQSNEKIIIIELLQYPNIHANKQCRNIYDLKCGRICDVRYWKFLHVTN